MKVYGALFDFPDRLKQLAGELGIELSELNSGNRFFLQSTAQGLALIDREKGQFSLDFVNDHINYQRRGHRGKKELVARALGAHLGIERVLDLTAGLGQDAIFLSRLGFKVEASERNPWVYLLLNDAWQRAKQSEEACKFSDIHFHYALGADLLTKFAKDKSQISVFIDPMYPEKKKTALPRKEMQIFRDLIGNDSDAESLLEKALELEYPRVVVKRPLRAAPLKMVPQHQFVGNTVRFDLYLGAKL